MSEHYDLKPGELRTLCIRWHDSFAIQIERMAKGCIAALDENEELKKRLGRDIDYRALLLEYMRHVAATEGLTFVDYMHEGPHRAMLLEIEKEL